MGELEHVTKKCWKSRMSSLMWKDGRLSSSSRKLHVSRRRFVVNI